MTTPNLACILGTISSGATVHVVVGARAHRAPGYFTNRAVVGSASDDPTLANNVARATVRVIPRTPPTAGLG